MDRRDAEAAEKEIFFVLQKRKMICRSPRPLRLCGEKGLPYGF